MRKFWSRERPRLQQLRPTDSANHKSFYLGSAKACIRILRFTAWGKVSTTELRKAWHKVRIGAPLWGLGDRIFPEAIRLHDSGGSEAHGVAANYAALPDGQKQDLLNFLRSL